MQIYEKTAYIVIGTEENRYFLFCAEIATFVADKPRTVKRLELLAPAKDLASAIDAIDCGADAVYIGGTRFGARYAATNSAEDIARAAEYAHTFGAKLYATLNTLLFDDELDEAQILAQSLVDAGADALIVQDMAYCRMGLPVELHASTQTACTTPERVAFFEQAGFARAILERSLSADEIRAIRSRTNIELEAFVHGAICVSQSGRCFLSRSMSERSGNRGECSQPCRLAYDLTDATGNTIIKSKHLLSVRDLDLSARIGEMIDAGITSFKIEGRLKDRTYLRNTVSHYRRLLDAEIARRGDCMRSSCGRSTIEFAPDPAKSFTRGASEYFFDGKRAGVASFDTPKAMGERIGCVVRTAGNAFTLDCDNDLATGDGICFIAGGELVGTNVNAADGRRITPNRMDGIARGTEIYRNCNRLFSLAVERSRIRRTIAADVSICFLDDGIEATATDEQGIIARARIDCETAEAKNAAKMEEVARTQMSRSGDTPFEIRRIEIVGGIRFAPSSAMAALRRELLERLRMERIANHQRGDAFRENTAAIYPDKSLTPQDNVTNRLARKFYASHGAEEIAEGLDCRATTAGERVMISDYCIRREIGECLRERHTLDGRLFLERGRKRYELNFDCAHCRMSLTDVSEQR